MLRSKIILVIFSLLFLNSISNAQAIERYKVFSYNVNEGLLQSHAEDIAFDKNNIGWLSFSNGIQKFDGNKFVNIPIQPGLPDDKSAKMFRTSKGDLLISHSSGISKYETSNNKFTIVYRSKPKCLVPSIFLGEEDRILYFFTGCASIIGIDINTFAVKSIAATGFTDTRKGGNFSLKTTGNIINHTIGFYTDSSFILWDLIKKRNYIR